MRLIAGGAPIVRPISGPLFASNMRRKTVAFNEKITFLNSNKNSRMLQGKIEKANCCQQR
jgi:hypothetical protein